MKVLYVSKSQPLAITFNSETMKVECWHAPEHKSDISLKTFTDKTGKKRILSSDNGYRWWSDSPVFARGERKEAENCYYGTMWFGSFPYGSWCIAVRIDKLTKEVAADFFDTEINCRGVLPVDKWIEECKSYVSASKLQEA